MKHIYWKHVISVIMPFPSTTPQASIFQSLPTLYVLPFRGAVSPQQKKYVRYTGGDLLPHPIDAQPRGITVKSCIVTLKRRVGTLGHQKTQLPWNRGTVSTFMIGCFGGGMPLQISALQTACISEKLDSRSVICLVSKKRDSSAFRYFVAQNCYKQNVTLAESKQCGKVKLYYIEIHQETPANSKQQPQQQQQQQQQHPFGVCAVFHHTHSKDVARNMQKRRTPRTLSMVTWPRLETCIACRILQ